MGTLVISLPNDVVSLEPNIRSGPSLATGWLNAASLEPDPSIDAELIAGLAVPGADGVTYAFVPIETPLTRTFRIVFQWTGLDVPFFSLDGAPPISFNNLPQGFLMNANLISHMETAWDPSSANIIDFSVILRNEITQHTAGPGAGATVLFNELESPGMQIVSDIPTDYISAQDFMASQLTYEMSVTDIAFSPGPLGLFWSLSQFSLEGTYIAVSYQQQWEVFVNDEVDPIPAGEPIKPGDRIHIVVPTPMDEGDHDLTNIDKIELTFDDRKLTIHKDGTFTIEDGTDEPFLTQEDSPYVIEWTDEEITIIIPYYGWEDYEGPVSVAPVVTPPSPFPPTDFSGSITIGEIEILFADVSGIYNITPNKTNDTIYDPARDGTTLDVAIPKPYVRTGFVGS